MWIKIRAWNNCCDLRMLHSEHMTKLLWVHPGGASLIWLLPLLRAPFWENGVNMCLGTGHGLYQKDLQPGHRCLEGKGSRGKGRCLSVSPGGLNPIRSSILQWPTHWPDPLSGCLNGGHSLTLRLTDREKTVSRNRAWKPGVTKETR